MISILEQIVKAHLVADGPILRRGSHHSVFKYARQAFIEIPIDLLVRKPQNSPATLKQVCRLTAVLRSDLRLRMPVKPVAKDYQLPIKDDEIHNPATVERNLLSKLDTIRPQEVSYLDLNSRPTPICMQVGNSAEMGAQVNPASPYRVNTRWELVEGLAAIEALTFDFLFVLWVIHATLAKFAPMIVSAGPGAEFLESASAAKFLTTPFAYLRDATRNRWISTLSYACAFGGAEPPTTSEIPQKNLLRRTAGFADHHLTGITGVFSSLREGHIHMIIDERNESFNTCISETI